MTPPAVPRPPVRFRTVNICPLPAGTPLHRNHARAFAPAGFNPCLGQATRFAPFDDADGACVPTLYAATSREAAAFESVFHDIPASAPFKTVRLDAVKARSASTIAPRRDLRLASLYAPDLKNWGIERRDLIETPKSTYDRTVLWAKAIHHARHDIDGLIWTSRQCDPDRCVVLFGDRIDDTSFDVQERRDAASDAGLLLELREFGRRAGIVIVS